MDQLKNDGIRSAVRVNYGRIALANSAGCGCGCSPSSCCGGPGDVTAAQISRGLGYSDEDVAAVPEGANMGLGCGNPQAIASLKAGEIVLDLGSGGGFDCFLAAHQVGDTGRVIGVDMTPEMISTARANAERGGFQNVEFRLGEIENLPVADDAVDVIMSNCVINLSPNKPRVFAEAYRVLKPGGRLAISDVVALTELPEEAKEDLALYAGCLSGASLPSEVEAMLHAAGFGQVSVTLKDESRAFIRDWAPESAVADCIISATIAAVKPTA